MTEKPVVYHPLWGDFQDINGLKLFFITPEMLDSFNEFNPVVILGGTISSVTDKSKRVAEAAKREREIFNALENGSLVCITFLIDSLVIRVLKRIGIRVRTWEEPRVDFIIKRSEFFSFLKKFGSTQIFFLGDFDDIISITEDGYAIGFTKKVGKGALIFLPCHVLAEQFTDGDFLREILLVLLNALKTYLPKIQYKPPSWINSFRFPNEDTIVSEVEKFQREISKRKESLEGYLRLKEILWFRDDELVNSVINFFIEMGIETKRDEIYEEDFWIIEHNKETVIVEVKGLDGNLKRPHISQLDEHRGAREKPDDFPALLLVNSFNKARSLKEKDNPISANEIKKAVRTNVLLLRTLDLCNAYSLMERHKLTSSQLLKVIRTETGWLKITPSGYEIKKT